MTETHEPDPIAAAAAHYQRADEAAKKARASLTELVLEALRQPDAKPADIARRASWTPAYVRKLARDNAIEAKPEYQARTEKTRARLLAQAQESTPAEGAPARPAAPPRLPGRIAALKPEAAKAIADRAYEFAPDRTAMLDRAADQVPQEWADHAVVAAALEAGLITEIDLRV